MHSTHVVISRFTGSLPRELRDPRMDARHAALHEEIEHNPGLVVRFKDRQWLLTNSTVIMRGDPAECDASQPGDFILLCLEGDSDFEAIDPIVDEMKGDEHWTLFRELLLHFEITMILPVHVRPPQPPGPPPSPSPPMPGHLPV